MRDPDPSGWAWWEAQVPSMGREQVRHAFDECDEFHNIIATLSASGAPSPAAASLATARVDPFNQTGDQIRARDCEWGITLLSLPGRGGLDLGLGLSYSSLVWTRSGPYAYFDEDRGAPSPGFRLGFATIQGPYFDAQAARNVYVLVTSSGRRTELRQVGTTNTYEPGDSSYLQLIAGGTLLLRSTDGTQMSYSPSVAQEWRATAIEDRNGNFISVGYDWRGDIASVTDTLGRAVTFNYDANANLQTVTQTWTVSGTAQTHTWASFGWGTQVLQPGFSSIAAVGTFAGETIPVLTQVGVDDGSRYNFEYTSAGQVNIIHRYSSDNVERSRMTYDYATLADDCPRVIDTRVRADNWTGINGVPAEVETQFGVEGDGSHSMAAPDGTVYKESYGTGWQKGLVVQEEVDSGGAEQRLSVTTWDQDNTGVTYQTNPRVKETNVYDFPTDAPSNRRRTTIDYGSYVQYGLPYLVTEYDNDGARELRRTYTDYNLAQAYLDRRIIGLISARHVYDPVAGQWLSKTSYAYDEAGSVGPQATTATGHDQSYVSTFLTRGNLTSVSQWDVTDIGNAAKAHTAHLSYDAAGSVVSTTDPLTRQTSIAYADSFSDGNNSRGTFAYATSVIAPGGFSTTVQYNYDFGARTRVQGPPPAEQTVGLIQTFAYDGSARLQQETTANNGSYIRYIYGPNYVATYSTVNNVADEAYTNTVFDGMGRTITAASNNPGGGGPYKAQSTQYDSMGRAVKLSNPADVDASWSPTGPDDGAGWLYTQQTYDWKGRPRVTTNPGDGSQKSASYSGCGCAGGEVVTLTDEAGRQQKLYSDPLGRRWKTEILNWDGSVYSTTESTLNALDQPAFVRQYQGTDQSGVFQETANSYDGYGRLQSSHAPDQDAGHSTTYSYNADDTPASVTDARGAAAVYSYNDPRGLLTGVSYTAPSGVTAPPSVTFSYDAAGNRSSMTTQGGAGGSVTYHYDTLSQLRSEDRQFPGLSGTYTLSYDYTLSGQLKSVTDQAGGTSFTYTIDSAGRPTQVDSTGFGAGAPLASGVRYRAWGALKHSDFGNGTGMTLGYDGRAMVSSYSLSGVKDPSTGALRPEGSDVQRYPDGLVKFASDYLSDAQNYGIQDRAYQYDQAGRLKEAYTGTDARNIVGGVVSNVGDGPFRQSYTYDEWDNRTGRTGRLWSQDDIDGESYTPQTDRNPAWSYDADGRLVSRNEPSPNGLTYVPAHYSFDAAGRQAQMTQTTSRMVGIHQNILQTTAVTQADTYGGDGLGIERAVTKQVNGGTPSTVVTYYLRSSVLGGRVISEYNSSGARQSSYAWAGGEVLAEQTGADTGMPQLKWDHLNLVTGDERQTDTSGRAVKATHMDPAGVDVGESDPFSLGATGDPTTSGMSQSAIDSMVASLMPGWGGSQCSVDGQLVGCGLADSLLSGGAASQCPDNECSRFQTVAGVTVYETYRSYSDGYEGYLGVGIDYVGDGFIFNSVWTGGAPEKNGLTDNPYESLIASFAEHGKGEGKGVRKRDKRLSTPSPQNAGKRAPLPEEFANLFDIERNYLLSLLADPDSDCAKFLKNTFGFNSSRVAKAVKGMRAFYADDSKITMGAAGLTPYHDPATGKSNPFAQLAVNEYFSMKRRQGEFIEAKVGAYSMKTMHDVYFSFSSSFTADEILHEALHIFTGGNDEVLADRLGVTLIDGDTTPINDALKNGGCGH